MPTSTLSDGTHDIRIKRGDNERTLIGAEVSHYEDEFGATRWEAKVVENGVETIYGVAPETILSVD